RVFDSAQGVESGAAFGVGEGAAAGRQQAEVVVDGGADEPGHLRRRGDLGIYPEAGIAAGQGEMRVAAGDVEVITPSERRAVGGELAVGAGVVGPVMTLRGMRGRGEDGAGVPGVGDGQIVVVEADRAGGAD